MIDKFWTLLKIRWENVYEIRILSTLKESVWQFHKNYKKWQKWVREQPIYKQMIVESAVAGGQMEENEFVESVGVHCW